MVGPTRQRSGAFDPAFVFIVLFPLLIISLSYELLSGERERGTLAMLLSQPIRQTDLAVGKAGARFAWVAAVTLSLALLGLAAGGVSLSQPGALLHALVYVLTLLCWGGVWFAAALWVNSRHGTSASNALALVGAWLIVVIIVPGLIKLAVDTVYPAPSSMELVHTAREAGLDAEKTLTNLKGRHDRDTSTQDYKAQMIASEELLASRLEPVLDAHRERQEQRSTVLNLLAYLSPAMVAEQGLAQQRAPMARHPWQER